MKVAANAPPLRVKGLAFGAPRDPIEFTLEAGSILAVLGDNGSGKSVLLSCLSGYRWTRGAVVQIHGFNIFHPRERAAAQRSIGVVFQNSGLIRNLTVFENVALPFLARSLALDSELEDKVKLRLDLVGCGHLIERSISQLSEGDRKCIALARALAGEARVLIADEPFAALSAKRRALVEELLVSLIESSTLSAVVFATQDLPVANRVASHFLTMDDPAYRLTGRSEPPASEPLPIV